MLISKKSLLVLIYVCLAFSLMLISVSFIFQVIGYWIGGGEQMLAYLRSNIYNVLKIGFVGIGVGSVYWFFYYRKI